MKKSFAALSVLLCPLFAFAGTAGNTKITWLHVFDNGVAIFYVSDQSRVSPPACVASGKANAFVIDTNTPGGKAFYVQLLTYQASGTSIFVQGTSACPGYTNGTGVEGVYYITSYDAS